MLLTICLSIKKLKNSQLENDIKNIRKNSYIHYHKLIKQNYKIILNKAISYKK